MQKVRQVLKQFSWFFFSHLGPCSLHTAQRVHSLSGGMLKYRFSHKVCFISTTNWLFVGMSNVPFLENARLQFEPFVISAGTKMSLRTAMQTLTEGVRDNMNDIDTWHLELHKFFRHTRNGGRVEAWRLAGGSRSSSFAWQRRLPEEKMESKLRRSGGSCARGDVLLYPQTVWLPWD